MMNDTPALRCATWSRIQSAQATLPIFRREKITLDDAPFTEFEDGPDRDRRLMAVNTRQNHPGETAVICLAYFLLSAWWLAELIAGSANLRGIFLILPLVMLLLPWLLQIILSALIYLPLRLGFKAFSKQNLPDNALMTQVTLHLLTLAAGVRVVSPGIGRWLALGWLLFMGLNMVIYLFRKLSGGVVA